MSSARSSSNLRVSRQPWFGVLIALVIVAVVVGGSFALKAFGDSRTEVERGALDGDTLQIDLVNSSSVTVVVDVTGVKEGDWRFPAPDSAAPDGLRGTWIDPGQRLSVTLALAASNTTHAPFKLSTTPMAGSSTGGVMTLYGQSKFFSGYGTIYWSWPTAEVPPSEGCSSIPDWSGPAGSYEFRGGRTGSITATARCDIPLGYERVTVITFTDTAS